MIRKNKNVSKNKKMKTVPRGDPTLSIKHWFSLKDAFIIELLCLKILSKMNTEKSSDKVEK